MSATWTGFVTGDAFAGGPGFAATVVGITAGFTATFVAAGTGFIETDGAAVTGFAMGFFGVAGVFAATVVGTGAGFAATVFVATAVFWATVVVGVVVGLAATLTGVATGFCATVVVGVTAGFCATVVVGVATGFEATVTGAAAGFVATVTGVTAVFAATAPREPTVVEDALVTWRKCHAGFAATAGFGGATAAIWVDTVDGLTAGDVLREETAAAFAPVDMTGGVTVVRDMRSAFEGGGVPAVVFVVEGAVLGTEDLPAAGFEADAVTP